MDMDVEGGVDRFLSDDDECSFCNGIGKLNKSGAPDCEHCNGTGVGNSYLPAFLKDGSKSSDKSQNW
jgi:DnaJ-class molecular chaperone